MRAGNPNCAVGFQNFLATLEPFEIEFVIQFWAARFVPIAFVHLDHFSGVATDTAVGKKIRRVGKNRVEPAFGIFRCDGVEQFETVAVVKPKAARVVVKRQCWRVFCVAFFNGNRSIFTQFKMRRGNYFGVNEIAVGFFRRLLTVKRFWLARGFLWHARSIDQRGGGDQDYSGT